MAELKNTYVNGNLAARKIYEGGTAIENKYGASLGISGSTIQLKDYKGNVLSSAILPAGSHDVTVSNTVTNAKVTAKGTATGFTASSSATNYYVTVSGTATNGSVTSNATCTSTAGYITAGTDTASDTDAVGVTITDATVYIPAGSHDVTVTNSITKAPEVAVSGTATGFTASTSATSYYVTASGTPTNGSVTSNATCTSTAGYIGAGTDVASDTDVITPTVTGSGNKIYIPVGNCKKNNFTVETTNNSGIFIMHTAGYVPASIDYIKTIVVPTKKTLSSVTLTSGDSSARTYLTTATVNPYTTISTLNLSGAITLLDHNSDGYVSTQDLGEAGAIKTLISSGGYIGTVSGTLAINNVGTSSTASTLTVGTNTYGTVNVWNTGGDKGVQVTNHTVKVDGTTVTDDRGDLIIASGVSIGNQGQYDVTIGNENTSSSGSGYYPLTQTQLAISASTPGWFSSGTDASVVVGRIKKGTITNNTSGGTSTDTIPRGKQIKISSGYYKNDVYYTASSAIPDAYIMPENDIEISQQTGTDVSTYATASVRSAGNYSLSITNKGNTTVTVGSENTNSSGSGYYPLTASLTGTLSASTTGWFSSGSATDASVVVGRIKKGTITNNTSGGTSTDTIPRGKQIKIGSGYHAADKYYTAQSNSGTKTITNNGYHTVDGYTRALVDVHNTPDSYAYLLGLRDGATIEEETYFGLHVEGTDCSNNVYYSNLILVDEFYSDDDNYGSLLFKATCENMSGGSGEYHWFLTFDNYYFTGRIGSTVPDPAD